MAPIHRTQNTKPKAGDELRDHAADLLELLYGEGKIEKRANGKKVDCYFEVNDFGKKRKLFLEAKDYNRNLNRDEVLKIYGDYDEFTRSNSPVQVLIITRNGLSTDAESFIDERPHFRHRTILELENDVVGMDEYVRHNAREKGNQGVIDYFVSPYAHAHLDGDNVLKKSSSKSLIVNRIEGWISDTSASRPLAILGGYGQGKTSLADWVFIENSKKYLKNPSLRIPVLIKLGRFVYSSKLSGVLSEIFDKEHRVERYSFHRFKHFNEMGRFLIILDGFDEMKHAMSWHDFENIVSELSALNCKNSKLLLLGRPSAFTTDNQAYYVLKGRKAAGDGWVKLPNWPEFECYTLANFDNVSMEEFVSGYLTSQFGLPEEDVNIKANHILDVASKDISIYSKPVHLKMLCELYSSHECSTNLSIDTEYSLYEFFINDLLSREAKKEARGALDADKRKAYLQSVATYLWKDKGAQTSFHIKDIPDTLIRNVAPDIDNPETGRREAFSCPLIERKENDIYYFSHRSFAEFLVASSFLNSETNADSITKHVDVIYDGSLDFVRQGLSCELALEFINALPSYRGKIRSEFLEALYIASDYAPIGGNSSWSYALEFIDQVQQRSKCDRLLLDTITSKSCAGMEIILEAVFAGELGASYPYDSNFWKSFAKSLIARLFELVTDDGSNSSRAFFVEGPDAVWLKKAASCLLPTNKSRSGLQVVFECHPVKLIDFVLKQRYETGASIVYNKEIDRQVILPFSMSLEELSYGCSEEATKCLLNYFRFDRPISKITEVAAKRRG
ncbi:hypothetical protein OCEANICA350_10375 [Oceanicaulis sp. 350]|nr:hypothetical protein OCEANICA350_10375 [Oceanicaulis sp. 350]